MEQTWQHLNFFEHACYLHCAVARITTSSSNVVNVAVPWARGANSGFTLLFEALTLAMIEREMPINHVAELMQVNLQHIWMIFSHSMLQWGLIWKVNV
ncbi:MULTISPECIES: ISL3 family transposase [Nitrosomonas]|uniref:ISL3 family transposase n=1 Tax=Nitrosomonas TaxID=914 RepID=UPI00069AE883|nr:MULTISPECIES: ISL3 family transposase [Nitrosomonas]UVS62677.1 ISL3 family transposase [Nitrosomonas sp. PLL12]